MVTAASAAFAVDGIYAAIKDRIRIPKAVTNAWKKNRTARPAQVLEIIKLGCEVGDREAELRHVIKTVFQFRDWSAHPPVEFKEPVRREDLKVGVPWQYVAFSASNARQLITAALDIATFCVWNPKLIWPDLVVWAESKRNVVNELRTAAGLEPYERQSAPSAARES